MTTNDKNRVEIVDMSREEVQDKIDEIYERFPMLRDRTLTSDCSCCEHQDVREEYGHAAERAWENLESWKWLLGDGEN